MSGWTTALPTKPGWYWVRIASYPPRLVELGERKGELMFLGGWGICPVAQYGSGDAHVLKAKHEWLGPLVPPEGP